MKRIFLLILAAILLFTISCQTNTEVKKDEHSNHNVNKDVKIDPANLFTADLKTNPAEVKAGEKIELSLTIKNANGETVKDFQIVHEKLLHLLIVSDDLAEFYHEHPEQQADGSFKVPFTFKNGGVFKLYADLKPKDSGQIVKSFNLAVSGNDRAREEIKVDDKLEKTVGDLFVTLKSDENITAGKDLMLNFQVFDVKTQKPVTDLQNYLGEKAHFVVISQDLKDFVHAHPMSRDNVKSEHSHTSEEKHEEKLQGAEAESIVSAHINFPNSGLYKIFAQFQRNGKVITVPFVINVKDADGTSTYIKPVEVPKGSFRITVNKDGFVPNEVSFAQGSFSQLAFYRADSENCADEVVFKSLKIRKKLPVGEVVLVDLPKDFSGELNFACGMDMFKGKVLIEEAK
jgi:Cupredoxin-like domain